MPIRLVAFDLDGTLIRGRNSLSVIGAALGRPEWEERMEILHMRGETPQEMSRRVAPWTELSRSELRRHLVHSRFAPGVDEAFQLLHERRVTTAIVSIGWDFMVEWFAERFGAAHWAAVRFNPDGTVTPFWPEDKGPWLERLMATLHVAPHEVAAVGDSPRDAALLRAAGHRFYVGADDPKGLADVRHHPDGDMAAVARAILSL
ncbi:MAG TPA: haloacid dehalogenase-like hydrolase [Methylomirabilota bacterium]|jgi:phosphoserine phosphatase